MNGNIRINNDLYDISVNMPDNDPDGWYVSKSKSFNVNKNELVVNEFETDFPHIKLLGNDSDSKYKFLTKLVNRNEGLVEWFSIVKSKYINESKLPLYLDTIIEPDEYVDLEYSLNEIKKIQSQLSIDKEKLNKKYRSEMEDLNNQASKKIDKICLQQQELYVLTLSSLSLPLTLCSQIESYNPNGSDEEIDIKKKMYARELLIQYKIALLKFINDNPSKLITDVINSFLLK